MTKKQIFHNETDAFFQERWKEKVADEGGRKHHHKNSDKEEKSLGDEFEKMEDGEAIHIYLEIVESIGDDEELKPLLKDLESAILNYDTTIKKFQLQKEETVISEKPSLKDREESDLARRLAHNNLISVLSALSRAYVKKYGVNKWRYKIDEGSGDRDRIAKWAKDVAPYITNKI